MAFERQGTPEPMKVMSFVCPGCGAKVVTAGAMCDKCVETPPLPNGTNKNVTQQGLTPTPAKEA